MKLDPSNEYFINKQSNENMHRQICRLARKQSNFILAERLLTRDDTTLPILESEPANLAIMREHEQWMEFERLKLLHSQISEAKGDLIPILNKLLDLSQKSSGNLPHLIIIFLC